MDAIDIIKRPRAGIHCDVGVRVIEDGEIISENIRKSHSFVRNFMYAVLRSMDGVGNTNFVTTGGAAAAAMFKGWCTSFSPATYTGGGLNTVAAAGEVNRGLVIGTSNTPFAVTQYNLQAPIANGAGVGQMTYAAMVNPPDPSFVSPDITMELSRDIANNSGSDITVRELGFFGYPVTSMPNCWGPSAHSIILLARDVIDETLVANGQVLNVRYIFKTVV